MQAITPDHTLKTKGVFYCLKNPEEYDGPRFLAAHHKIAMDALENVHFGSDDPDYDACCSVESPCECAARYLLATGRVAGARGYVPDPRGRPTNYIADKATGIAAPVGPGGRIQVHEQPPKAGQGTGSAGGRRSRKSGPKSITHKQYETLASLLSQITSLDPKRATMEPSEFPFKDFERMTARDASALISSLISVVKDMRAKAAQDQDNRAEDELCVGAMYRHNEEVYWVKRGRTSGRLYAQRVVIDGEDATLEYAKGVVNHLKAGSRLDPQESLEIASRYGRTSGSCMICSRKLTNPESLAEGIGPICKDKI